VSWFEGFRWIPSALLSGFVSFQGQSCDSAALEAEHGAPIHEEGDTVCEEPLITITDLKAAAWKQSRKAPLEIK